MEETIHTTTSSNHKTRNIIIGVVVALLIVGGISAYLVNQDNQQKETAKKAAAATAAANNQATTTKNVAFAPATTEGVPFVATTKTTANGKSVGGVMTSDAAGNVSYAYQVGGKEATLTYTKDGYYLCIKGDQCIKYATAQTAEETFDPSVYQFDGTKLEELKNTAAYKGQQTCPSPATGTCDVWSVANGNVTSTMYVSTETKRIVKVTTVNGTTSNEATYEYKNATVTIPTNYKTVPTQQ